MILTKFSRILNIISKAKFNRSVSTTKTTFGSSILYRDALNAALDEEMKRDSRVFILGEDIGLYEGAYKVTKGLMKKYGEKRIVDTPITEIGFTGLAIGAAMSGLRPVCEFMTFNFAMQSIDQIVNSAAKTFYMSAGLVNVPIVFRGANGPAAGLGGQHSQCYAAWYSHVPGLKVVAPYNSEDAKGLLKSAIRDPDPVIFFENDVLYAMKFPVSDQVLSDEFLLPLNKAKIEKEGKHVTIASHSRALISVMQAEEQLAGEGIKAEIINMRSLRPLDMETIYKSVKKTNHLIYVEIGWPQCGIGSEIAALIMETDAFYYLDAPVIRVTSADVPVPYADTLEATTVPLPSDIVEATKRVLSVMSLV